MTCQPQFRSSSSVTRSKKLKTVPNYKECPRMPYPVLKIRLTLSLDKLLPFQMKSYCFAICNFISLVLLLIKLCHNSGAASCGDHGTRKPQRPAKTELKLLLLLLRSLYLLEKKNFFSSALWILQSSLHGCDPEWGHSFCLDPIWPWFILVRLVFVLVFTFMVLLPRLRSHKKDLALTVCCEHVPHHPYNKGSWCHFRVLRHL